jgi:hypothetical protein
MHEGKAIKLFKTYQYQIGDKWKDFIAEVKRLMIPYRPNEIEIETLKHTLEKFKVEVNLRDWIVLKNAFAPRKNRNRLKVTCLLLMKEPQQVSRNRIDLSKTRETQVHLERRIFPKNVPPVCKPNRFTLMDPGLRQEWSKHQPNPSKSEQRQEWIRQ